MAHISQFTVDDLQYRPILLLIRAERGPKRLPFRNAKQGIFCIAMYYIGCKLIVNA